MLAGKNTHTHTHTSENGNDMQIPLLMQRIHELKKGTMCCNAHWLKRCKESSDTHNLFFGISFLLSVGALFYQIQDVYRVQRWPPWNSVKFFARLWDFGKAVFPIGAHQTKSVQEKFDHRDVAMQIAKIDFLASFFISNQAQMDILSMAMCLQVKRIGSSH